MNTNYNLLSDLNTLISRHTLLTVITYFTACWLKEGRISPVKVNHTLLKDLQFLVDKYGLPLMTHHLSCLCHNAADLSTHKEEHKRVFKKTALILEARLS